MLMSWCSLLVFPRSLLRLAQTSGYMRRRWSVPSVAQSALLHVSPQSPTASLICPGKLYQPQYYQSEYHSLNCYIHLFIDVYLCPFTGLNRFRSWAVKVQRCTSQVGSTSARSQRQVFVSPELLPEVTSLHQMAPTSRPSSPGWVESWKSPAHRH